MLAHISNTRAHHLTQVKQARKNTEQHVYGWSIRLSMRPVPGASGDIYIIPPENKARYTRDIPEMCPRCTRDCRRRA